MMSINFHSRIEAWITNYYLILFASKDIIILVKCVVSLVLGCVRLRGKNQSRASQDTVECVPSIGISGYICHYISAAKNKEDRLVPRLAVIISLYACYYSPRIQ